MRKSLSRASQGKYKQNMRNVSGNLGGFFTKFNNDWTMQSAASLAYNLMVAIVPIFIAVIAVFGFTVGQLNPAAQQQFVANLKKVFPLGDFSNGILQTALNALHRNAGFLGIVAILLAIFGGSRLFIAIEGCFAITYRTSPRNIIAQNIMAILMMILFIVLAPLMVFTSSLPALITALVQIPVLSNLPFIVQTARNGLFLSVIGILVGLLVAWILFEAIFFFVPNQRVSFKRSWPGALLSTILLELFLALFPLYTTHFMGSYTGTAGFAVILLLFFYYFAVILLLGAEVNAYFAEHIPPLPNNLAVVLRDTTIASRDEAMQVSKPAPPSF